MKKLASLMAASTCAAKSTHEVLKNYTTADAFLNSWKQADKKRAIHELTDELYQSA